MGKKERDRAIDSICSQGCNYVNSVLDDVTTRNECIEFTRLNDEDQALVLAELKSVMSVYAKTGSCEI